jgi:hypothetical protein
METNYEVVVPQAEADEIVSKTSTHHPQVVSSSAAFGLRYCSTKSRNSTSESNLFRAQNISITRPLASAPGMPTIPYLPTPKPCSFKTASTSYLRQVISSSSPTRGGLRLCTWELIMKAIRESSMLSMYATH